jgi:hypothetical protein
MKKAITTMSIIMTMAIAITGAALAYDSGDNNDVVTVTQLIITPQEREVSGMEQAMIDLFGEYQPVERVETSYRTHSFILYENGVPQIHTSIVEVPEIVQGVNVTWITGVALFALVLYSFFRCVGSLLKMKI